MTLHTVQCLSKHTRCGQLYIRSSDENCIDTISEKSSIWKGQDVDYVYKIPYCTGDTSTTNVINKRGQKVPVVQEIHLPSCSTSSIDIHFTENVIQGDIIPITPSRWCSNALRNSTNVESLILPKGIDETRFYPDPIGGKECRDQLGIRTSDKVLLWCSTDVTRDNLASTLKTFLSIALYRDDTHLIVKTTGDQRGVVQSTIKDVIKSVGHKRFGDGIKRCTFIDEIVSIDDMRHLYSSSDVFLAPYSACSQNCHILESLACGVPVVTVDHGPAEDILDCDKAMLRKVLSFPLTVNGYHFIQVEELALQNTLADVLDSPPPFHIRQNTSDNIRNGYSWSLRTGILLDYLNFVEHHLTHVSHPRNSAPLRRLL